ncbi:Cinnamyl alcohol dehydrogenase 7 [Striga hermonthica]|uniref:Cinnamyl alcohol dehydrogenase 7 n=1 Tax=Striga hermonthica TaxID=68872 RepID=A0A9N7N5J8_STRHE|nr:Cinnamyl alcohol dehydrogenase 7 [Striga hermonthica]
MAASLETEHPVKALAWAAEDPSGVFAPLNFSRRATGDRDVQFKVLYCGICHSDLHLAKNEWGNTIYPLIPGHEIVGVVTEVGSKVEKVKVGDKVGVGCLVGSCRTCDECVKNEESYCPKQVLSINARYYDGTVTYGGFSNLMVVDENFVIHWPEGLPLDAGAPLLCAGITTYSPLKRFGLDRPGASVGVVGLGGIGHLTVKFAKALGSKVTVISTSSSKKKEAIETFGADEFLVSHDQDQMQAIVGTASGGIKETEEMLEFCAKHKILPDVEIISMNYVNTAMERIEKNDVKYRFVIDVGNSLKD